MNCNCNYTTLQVMDQFVKCRLRQVVGAERLIPLFRSKGIDQETYRNLTLAKLIGLLPQLEDEELVLAIRYDVKYLTRPAQFLSPAVVIKAEPKTLNMDTDDNELEIGLRFDEKVAAAPSSEAGSTRIAYISKLHQLQICCKKTNLNVNWEDCHRATAIFNRIRQSAPREESSLLASSFWKDILEVVYKRPEVKYKRHEAARRLAYLVGHSVQVKKLLIAIATI